MVKELTNHNNIRFSQDETLFEEFTNRVKSEINNSEKKVEK